MTRESFAELYSKLNEKQKQAVDQIEGPVMVVAGPGTGKTQILAARIANILEKTDTNPYQILCLTYTDAGVVAMRERLLSFIGPLAYRVHIHTFHSLCNEIIQFNGSYFGYKNLQPASDLEIYEILQEMIDELPSTHPLKRLKGEVYYEAEDLKSLFDILKKEHFSIEYISAQADRYLQDKEDNGDFTYKVNGKSYKKGDRKEKDYREEKMKIDKLKAALDLFPVFNRKMTERKLYDFSDMILWVLDAFRNDKDFLLNYQERYLYFLVDEFQDTNGAQLELINYLTEYWEIPNLFVVGDDDQSIYRFQGANVGNILNFASTYSDKLKTIVLTDNYRSTQAILDASRALININTERLNEIDKHLTARHKDYSEDSSKPDINCYLNPIHETVAVGEAILKLHESGVPYSNMAVLYRNHRHSEELLRYFNAYQIPYNSKRKVNILDELLVKKLLTILTYIHAEITRPYSGEAYIFEILNYDFYPVRAIDLARLSPEVRKSKKRWREFLTEKLNAGKDLFAELPGLGSRAELRRLVNDLEYWIKEANNVTVPQLVERLIAKGGILSYVMQADSKRWQMQILRTFFDFVKEEAAKMPGMTLKDLLDKIDTYRNFGMPVEAMQILHVPDSVNMMTLHGSKGLEFEHVFIIRGTDDEWIKKRGNKRDYNLSKIMAEMKGEDSDTEEVRRLMYVGMTRAKKGLHMSYFRKDMKDKEVNKLQFLAELESLAGLKETAIDVEDDKVLNFEMLYYQYEEIPDFELLDHDYLDILLENYTLSATHLNTYLKCPVSFYFNHVLKVPSAKSESASFGTAIHFALEELFREYQKDESLFPGSEQLQSYFERSMYANRDSFTDKSYQRYLSNGRIVLPEYYKKYRDEWEKEKVFTVEKNIVNVEVSGVPLKGKLDRIVFDGNEVYVIDFKTGDFEKAVKKCRPPKPDPKPDKYEEVYGGDYWRQMVFYRILIENDRSNKWHMQRGEMNFVEPDKHGHFHREVFQIDNSETDIVKEQIKDTYSKIKAHQFDKGCGDDYCQWCNFVKYYLKKEIYISETLPGSKLEEAEGMS